MKNKQINHFCKTILIFVVLIGFSSCQSRAAQVPGAGSDPVLASPEVTAVTEPSIAELPVDDQDNKTEDECLICHADQEKLMETANPVAVKESESSGEG
jgi:hypothetical protein